MEDVRFRRKHVCLNIYSGEDRTCEISGLRAASTGCKLRVKPEALALNRHQKCIRKTTTSTLVQKVSMGKKGSIRVYLNIHSIVIMRTEATGEISDLSFPAERRLNQTQNIE